MNSQYIAILISLIVLLAGAGAQEIVERRENTTLVVLGNETARGECIVNETLIEEAVARALSNATPSIEALIEGVEAEIIAGLNGTSCNETQIAQAVAEAVENAVEQLNLSLNLTLPPVNTTCNCTCNATTSPDIAAYWSPENGTVTALIAGEHSVREAYLVSPNLTLTRLSIESTQQLGPVTIARMKLPPGLAPSTIVNPGPGGGEPLLALVLEDGQTVLTWLAYQQGGGGGGGQY